MFISGQTPQKDNHIPLIFEEQLKNVLEKIEQMIVKNNLCLQNIIKMNVYLTDSRDLDDFRETLGQFLGEHKPAMTLVIVSELVNPNFKVEIDAIVGMNH